MAEVIEGPLAGIAVVDLSRSVAGAWCSRMLADMGAEVLMLEPPGGHPLRTLGRLADGRSPLAEYVLANKRSGELDLATAEGREALAGLTRAVDAVVSSFTRAELERLGLETAAAAAGGAIWVHITPHGLDGPLADVPGSELTAAAWSGWASVNGLAGKDPLKPVGWQSSYCAGTAAAAAAIAALFERQRLGSGVEIDIATVEVMAATFAPAVLREQYTGAGPPRPEAPDVSNGPVEVADGHFALTLSRGHFWREAMTLLGLPDLADDPRWETAWFRQSNKHLYTGRVEAAMRSWEKMRLFEELALRRVVAGPVLSIAELRANEHLRARGAWVAPGGEGDPVFPGPPFRMSRTPLALHTAMPPMPAGAAQWPDRSTRTDREASPARARPGTAGTGLPLAGVRGVVLTQAWAGTFCTELLAFLGADVIQVEVRRRLDSWRGSYDAPMPERLRDVPGARHAWNCNPLYNSVNLGKRCVTLDLQHPEGVAVFRRLVRHADFVTENFSPRVMGNLGLGYEALRAIRPDVILCSLSAYGHEGPWANVPGIGGTIEPTSGMSALLGYAGGPPLNSGQMYPDAASGLLGAVAIAAALYHRERTGEGQFIDLSMQEACLAFIGEAVLEEAFTGRQPGRRGNEGPPGTAQFVVGCRDGAWLALSCESQTQQTVLAAIAGNELDAGQLGAWAAMHSRDEALALLWEAGIPAAPVLDAAGVRTLPHFLERGVVRDVPHPEAGTWAQVTSPFHFVGRRSPQLRPAPCLGEHSLEVFRELLGMDEAEYGRLVALGVSGEGPPD